VRPLTQVDPRERAITFTYDVEGRLTQITDPVGQGTTFTYPALFMNVHARSKMPRRHAFGRCRDDSGAVIPKSRPGEPLGMLGETLKRGRQ